MTWPSATYPLVMLLFFATEFPSVVRSSSSDPSSKGRGEKVMEDVDEDRFQTVDVAGFDTRVYGTELILIESPYRDQKSYRFEDFFWTGSGDGDGDDRDWAFDGPTTVYETKTVVSTVYMETPSTSHNTTTPETTTRCSLDCESPPIPSGEITPSPTQKPEEETTTLLPIDEEDLNADAQFWLLTVLKGDGTDPVIIDLKNSLAKLYKTAFQRQQEKHLGIMNRKRREVVDKPVRVYIHNVEKTDSNGQESIQVLYHVAVDGKPVDAVTAASDMTLVSDEEVQKALGYPFVIKAEPYLKPAQSQSLSTARNTWVFIGVSMVALLVILLLVAFLTLALTKRKRSPAMGLDNRKQIFERGAVGQDNASFEQHPGDLKSHRQQKTESPTYINFRNQPSNQTVRSGIAGSSRPPTSLSSSSSSSGTLDISPLMGVKKQRTPPKKPPRPKAALNKTAPLNVKRVAPELYDSDSSPNMKRDSPDTIYARNCDPGVMSPKSYLSMPSVKSFPRGTMPEPLNKVLEPVSVLHLDMPDDDPPFEGTETKLYKSRSVLARHGSVGAAEDPGVLGPVVWDLHCQRMQHGVSVDEGMDDIKVTSNVSRMRKRFHDLLDDTFSLFGASRRESPVHEATKTTPIEVKSHSAIIDSRSSEQLPQHTRPRPKTTDLRRKIQSLSPTPGSSGPRGAWASSAPSPLVRPLSAGPVAPRVNVEHVLAEGRFKANDPAVPLIAAIKSEIEKCSLPGSTTDLAARQ